MSFSQEREFKFSKEGFTDFIVTECEGKTQAELYKKTLDWVSVTYKNPKEVIKAQIENDYIRVEGSSNSLICMNSLGSKLCNLATYQIEISFKDGKYKFDVIELKEYSKATQFSSGGWSEVGLTSTEFYYNKKGNIKGVFKFYPELIPNYFNDLNSSLKEFLLNEKIPSKKDGWK